MNSTSPTQTARHQRWTVTPPSFLHWLLAAGVLATTLLYFPLNHGTADQHVLITSLDAHLPFVPAFALPYLLFLPVFWLVVAYSFFTRRGFSQLALAIIITYLCSDITYALYHTYMPRPDNVTGTLSGLVKFVYTHDQPYNDFPSEHASSAVLLALYAWPSRRWRYITVVFAVLVVAATVLIRQHSIVGAMSGVLLAFAAWSVTSQLRKRLPGL